MSNLPFKVANALHHGVYRATGGRVGARIGKSPVLFLTTRGRRTGKPRTNALYYVPEGDALAVVASKGGAPHHPEWFLNLRAEPAVEVELAGRREQRRARVATAEERARLWPRFVEMYAGYDGYQRKTTREIPVVVLDPASGA
jgi:deazaflavin-dependent oxidoreductase (nitroreductase family)